MNHPRRKAVVVASMVPYRTVVRVKETGEEIDVTSALQRGYDVGTEGWVQYQSGAGFGLYFFTPDMPGSF